MNSEPPVHDPVPHNATAAADDPVLAEAVRAGLQPVTLRQRIGEAPRWIVLSAVAHGALLAWAFAVYDPDAVELRSTEDATRWVVAHLPPAPKPETEPVERPEPPPPPKATPKRRPVPKVVERDVPPTPTPEVEPEVEPQEVAEAPPPEAKPTPRKRPEAKTTGPKVIGAKSEDAAPRAVADRHAGGAVDHSVAEAAPDAAPATVERRLSRAQIRDIKRGYWRALNRFVKQGHAYPRRARMAGIEGTVLVELILAGDGRILQYRVLRSSGHEVLDKAALDAVAGLAKLPAPPAELNWRRNAVHIPFEYTLKG